MRTQKLKSSNHRFARVTSFLLIFQFLLSGFPAAAEIIPYEGPPGSAEQANKILIPYARFVELWNQAHPEDTIDLPRGEGPISFADVRYTVTVGKERLHLSLTAEIKTYGKEWAAISLPFSTLAVTEATFDGRPAQLRTGPKAPQGTPGGGMVLMIPGESLGRLELQAVMKPDAFGRRGNARFSVPPLPGAVMTVVLPEKDLDLEVDQIEAAPTKRIVDETVEYTFGLGMTRTLALRWLPSVGGGATDRTLSADAQHNVYVFHWAIVGVSKIIYRFPGGEYDRFALLVPQETMMTELEGTNIRDYREIGEKTVEGKRFKLIEIRLHRAAQKQHESTVRWISPHLDTRRESGNENPETSMALSLPRAGDVSRESGTVTLHSAGGMSVKVLRVTGGRRADVDVDQGPRGAELTADRAEVVGRYYWPYRPFSMSLHLSRSTVSPQVHLNQLVRISTDRVELFVQANLKAEEGKLFGASFALPQGYELLSAVGPAVANFYERGEAILALSSAGILPANRGRDALATENRRFLHIEFHRGQRETEIALALVRKDTVGAGPSAGPGQPPGAPPAPLDVPMVSYLDGQGRALPGTNGRLAVQVAASLEAETAREQNLKSISPQTLRDWLDARQIGSVQFAYQYELADPALQLTVRRLPTTIRAEVFTGLAVKATAAMYTYRVRYTISGSPVDHLRFRLPSEYAPLIAVESQAMRSVTQSDAGNDQTEWTVALINEVTGIVDIAVNFALPIDPNTTGLQIAPLQTETPGGYRALVAVQNVSRHEIGVTGSTNLSELGASEQQKLMPNEMRESLQYVFESFEDNWSLNLDFKPAKTATRIQAVVDLLEMTTVVQRSGRCRYEAKIALQNRSEQFLRVRMPQGLRLWSANVASVPVKPVVAADLPGTDVLIPLVKTSPGGLPYDVFLYFADEGSEPLVAPLNGMTKLKPPTISIIGLPVMQTTWSLRLPGGYRYIRPGGNMSPVADTVEVMSLGIKAKLEQLKRLERTYRDVAGSSIRRKQVAKGNWQAFNKKLADEIGQVESYLSARRHEVGEKEYERLQTKLGAQKQEQDALIVSNVLFDQQQQERARRDLNTFLNADVSNVGVSETVRNEILQEKPGFLTKYEEQQIARLEQELEESQQQLDLFEGKKKVPDVTEEAPKDRLFTVAGTKAGEVIGGPADKESHMNRALEELTRQSATQIDQKQAQIRQQLDELRDNRLQRHFQADLQKGRASRSQAEQQVRQPEAETAEKLDSYDYAQFYRGRDSRSRRSQSQIDGADVALGMGQRPAGRPATPPIPGQPLAPAAPMGTALYTAKGTYSLPVTLPEGGIRLDFTRPAGEAELSLWAVSQRTIYKLYGTICIVVGLLVMAGLAKVWPRPRTKQPISAKSVFAYILLLVAFTVVLGLVGFLVSLLAILLSEAKRGAFTRPQTAEA